MKGGKIQWMRMAQQGLAQRKGVPRIGFDTFWHSETKIWEIQLQILEITQIQLETHNIIYYIGVERILDDLILVVTLM